MTTALSTIILLAAWADGSIVTGPDGSPPTTALSQAGGIQPALHHLAEALGLDRDATRLAVTDTTSTSAVHHVAWCGPLPHPGPLPDGWGTVPFGQLLTALPPAARARVRTAARTGLLSEPVAYLNDGLRPGGRPSKSERTTARFAWHARTPTHAEDQSVHQVWGWLTDPRGRALVVIDHHGSPSLPGGRPEPGETREATLAREAMEEAAARHGRPTVLGFQQVTEAGQPPYLQLRMTARLLGIGPAAPDPDTGETYRRVLVPAAHANLLLGWGPEGDAQAAAVATALPSGHGCALRHVPETGWVPQGADGA
ncbi:NUDIX hydrolase [Streptomyces olivaceoviridis]|uniref:NUDIX hydrolase n=1 Tax=Streptomyces olivaceoviridis TaxID=1921 RepID=UPI00332EE2D4